MFESLQRSFRAAGYEAIIGPSGNEPGQARRTKQFDVVVIDLEMSNVPGVKPVGESRQTGAHTLVPVIVFVEKGLESDARRLERPLAICEVVLRPGSERCVIDAVIARVTGPGAEPMPQRIGWTHFSEAAL